MTCEEYKVANNVDQSFIDYVKSEKNKNCRKCGAWVSKIQGCKHMTCRCGHQFCYVCEKDWSGHKDSECKEKYADA